MVGDVGKQKKCRDQLLFIRTCPSSDGCFARVWVGLFRLAGQQLWALKPLAIGGPPPFYLLIDYLFNHLKPHQVCPAAQPQLPLI